MHTTASDVIRRLHTSATGTRRAAGRERCSARCERRSVRTNGGMDLDFRHAYTVVQRGTDTQKKYIQVLHYRARSKLQKMQKMHESLNSNYLKNKHHCT